MINIPEFDTVFKGKKFSDKTIGMQSDLVCVGYGDNQGNPYFLGVYEDTVRKIICTKTVLIKNADFAAT
jgi:hypothetical protein